MTDTRDNLPPIDFAARRARMLAALGNGILILRAPSLAVHANDVEYPYRPASDFFYATGFPEADAVAVLDASAEKERFVLFVQPRDPEKETWTGRRAGVEGAVERYGADAAYPMSELASRLVAMIATAGPLHFRLGHDEPFNLRLLDMARAAWAARPRTANDQPASLLDPAPIIHEMRLVKSEAELARMRRAIAIASEAHREAMRAARPGVHEHEIEALVAYTFRRRGAAGWAYPSIVAGGDNATILHYTANADVLRAGDLLLLDAGDEYDGYCADLTRTFPVGDDFTPEQRRIHDLVVAAQAAALEAMRPGSPFELPHERALAVLVEGLLSLGLLEGDAAQVISEGTYRRYFMHRTSHWLGMDVHDVGAYKRDGNPRLLEPGMVLTVEPGLYCAASDPLVPEAYRGIGVRIEDDVLITPGGHEVLSAQLARSADEVIALRERGC